MQKIVKPVDELTIHGFAVSEPMSISMMIELFFYRIQKYLDRSCQLYVVLFKLYPTVIFSLTVGIKLSGFSENFSLPFDWRLFYSFDFPTCGPTLFYILQGCLDKTFK
ncbi:MAG: hypothetical protein GX127_07015 [Eubacteriaceae bacterium]|nr:hypothetical protein [Eubacteriaceae bacterium]